MKDASKHRRHKLTALSYVTVAACLLFGIAPAAVAPVAPVGRKTNAAVTGEGTTRTGGATFDLFSRFPEQYLSPAGNRTSTFMPLDTRNIGRQAGKVVLTVSTESPLFTAAVSPSQVEPATDKPASSRVNIECSKDTPDNTIGWVKVVGTRGTESHRIWLKATVLASSPYLDLTRGPTMGGQGYLDPRLKAWAGNPVTWHVSARNEGMLEDTYTLTTRTVEPIAVVFKDNKGKKIEKITVPGKTRNLLYSRPVFFTAEADTGVGLPAGEPQDITIVLGPGKRSRTISELKVQLLNPGRLFCANDLSGPRPHPHQVFPGESTSFIFHATNFAKAERTMRLDVPRTEDGWPVQPVGPLTKTAGPGETVQFEVKVTSPRNGSPGERREFTARLGSASSTVAVEVTGTRNIYYWSIDSMDPEYLDLDREGTAAGKDGDWLMPNTRGFFADSARYTDARCYLPSATDMNHTNALAGTMTGTQGVYMVGGTFKGFTEHDETLSGPNTADLLRYGPEGRPIERTFEVAKRETGGKALTGFWSNKNWLADFEGSRSVDIVGHSESWPLFFDPPQKYKMAGDPTSEKDKSDPASVSVRACFHSNNADGVVIPSLLGQFDLIGGSKLLSSPLAVMFGKTPGLHAEDRYIAGEFFRSIAEEDPDVAYINIGDLDNTGHFTGSSWDLDEWMKGDGPSPAYDVSKYSPFMRRKEALDICREADLLFRQFVDTLKARGVYDNSTIVVLSDHGMENMKDPKSGYEVLDLRDILRQNGMLRHEDYEEVGGTELNNIWSKDPAKLARIQKILEEYTVEDKELGSVRPLMVVNREEARTGKDYGKFGKVLPGELYSEYWANNPDPSEKGEIWPDLFVFPLYNYQVVAHGDALASGINNVGLSFGINVPESVKFGLPGAHGGLQTNHIPLLFKAPAGGKGAQAPGSTHGELVEIGDIAPTIYGIMGWTPPECVDGKPLP